MNTHTQDIINVFTEFIKKKSLKMTGQRKTILLTFLEMKHHVSPEELYNRVKARDSKIGIATVYRVLKLLNQSGIAREVNFRDGFARYESNYNREHHDHLVCQKCGATVEIVDSTIEEMQEKLAVKYGYDLKDHEMLLYGICSKCQ